MEEKSRFRDCNIGKFIKNRFKPNPLLAERLCKDKDNEVKLVNLPI